MGLTRKFIKRELDDISAIRGIRRAKAVTPSDSDHLVDPDSNPVPTRAVIVGVAGNLSCVFADSDDIVTITVAAGIWHPMEVRQIRTASTATGIVAGW